ncbi:Cysteine desulfuration protein SufE [compost metagenome]
MSLPAKAQEALETFAAAGSWEQRARLLMQWGEKLDALTDTERGDSNRVHGCESQVWLVGACQGDHWHFRAASDARLLRGLLAVLLVRVNGLPSEELAGIDLADWFNQLGLARQLSPSRSNGLNAVLKKMREMAL